MMNKAVFLDRDGTIIKQLPYLSDPEQVELLPNAVPGVKLLRAKGFKIIVLTNQSGIGRGYFSLATLKKVNNRFYELLGKSGVPLDKLYFCPHKPESHCNCRKPKPGMLEQARKDFDINLKESYIIGDKPEDIELGKFTGVCTILVLTGYGEETSKRDSIPKVAPNFIAKDLLEAANWICSNDR